MLTASDAIQRLQEGNRRFARNLLSDEIPRNEARRRELFGGQKPFAIVLGCSDSRVPVETIFDQGLGDLFVVRNAGNFVTPVGAASIEFAAAQLGVRLVIVLGHTQCGAITATHAALTQPAPAGAADVNIIVDSLRPVVEPLLAAEPAASSEDLIARAVRDNVRVNVAALRDDSAVLADLIANDGLQVIGAEYDLATGAVEFFASPGS